MERGKSLAEQAKILLDWVDDFSKEVARGGQVSAMALFYQFVAKGPDDGPPIHLTHELLQTLSPHEKFVLEIARLLCVKANEVIGGSAGSSLTWDNPDLRFFFQTLGAGIQGALHSKDTNDLAVSYGLLQNANHHADNLIDWAEKQLA